jgi:hypothetical protein
MRLLPVAVMTVLAAALLFSNHASAFSSDPTSGTNVDGSSRYVDPDDQIHSRFGLGGDGSESQTGYDRGSDHRRLSAPEVISGQGVLVPNSIFSTAPPSR